MSEARRYASSFAALGHEARLEILRHLLAASPGGLVAGELQVELAIPASTLSHHLDALRQEGLVLQEREGRFLRYRAHDAALQELLAFLYAECCTREPLVQLGFGSSAEKERPAAD
jgi:ArsR family transcriptional regulator